MQPGRNITLADAREMEPLLAQREKKEEEVRDLLEGYVVERRAILDQIEAGWQLQTRRPTAAEVDAWMAVGRP